MVAAFLLKLAAGCVLMLTLCRTQHVSFKFFRLMNMVAAGLIIVATGFLLQLPDWRSDVLLVRALWFIGGSALLCVAAMTLNNIQGDRPRDGQRIIAGITALVLIVAATTLLTMPPSMAPESTAILPPTAPLWEIAGHTLLASIMLGSVTAAMLLGHAYLTLTAMPIDPLRRLTLAIAAALVLRTIWTAVTLARGWSVLFANRFDPTWPGLMVSVRTGVGLLLTAVLTYMVYDCVKRRSTQSATGILYIAMIMAFFGELSASALAAEFQCWL